MMCLQQAAQSSPSANLPVCSCFYPFVKSIAMNVDLVQLLVKFYSRIIENQPSLKEGMHLRKGEAAVAASNPQIICFGFAFCFLLIIEYD